MHRIFFILVVLVGLTCAAPQRERRQVNCSFHTIPNVCFGTRSSATLLPHPTDNTKFLQCDIYNRMFIIECPVGEVWNSATNNCSPQAATTPARVLTPQPPILTQAPNNPSNPCTPEGVARGQIYFPVPGDNTRYYECTPQAQAAVLSCLPKLIWEQSVQSCVYPLGAASARQGGAIAPNPANLGPNPCTPAAIAAGQLFFPYADPHKFIQCDLWGEGWLVTCPNHLAWNAQLETCYSPDLQVVPSSGK